MNKRIPVMKSDYPLTRCMVLPACLFLFSLGLLLPADTGHVPGDIRQARKMALANLTTCLKKGGAVQPTIGGDIWLCAEQDGMVSEIAPVTQEEADALLERLRS